MCPIPSSLPMGPLAPASAAMLSSVVFAVQLIDARSDALAWNLASNFVIATPCVLQARTMKR
jgi:hypothetical protein